MQRARFWFAIAAITLALGVFSAAAQDSTPVPASDWPAQYYAPYVYVGQMPLVKTMEVTGVRYFTLAFILAGRECVASWGGASLLKNMPFLPREIQSLREKGGDVMVSFGGAGGDELALRCPDVESLTAQYQAVIDAYDLTHLDFDIEGDEIRDPVSIERRSQAIAALQTAAASAGKRLSVAFTLPVLPTGLTDAGACKSSSGTENGGWSPS